MPAGTLLPAAPQAQQLGPPRASPPPRCQQQLPGEGNGEGNRGESPPGAPHPRAFSWLSYKAWGGASQPVCGSRVNVGWLITTAPPHQAPGRLQPPPHPQPGEGELRRKPALSGPRIRRGAGRRKARERPRGAPPPPRKMPPEEEGTPRVTHSKFDADAVGASSKNKPGAPASRGGVVGGRWGPCSPFSSALAP